MNQITPPARWGRRILFVWIILAILSIGFYFMGVWTGYFGSYENSLMITEESLATPLGRAVLPLMGLAVLLAAITTLIWRQASLTGSGPTNTARTTTRSNNESF